LHLINKPWIISRDPFSTAFGKDRIQAYLPGTGVNPDPEGGSPGMRLRHSTSPELTPAIASNVGDSGA